jgi:hypothetical protein
VSELNTERFVHDPKMPTRSLELPIDRIFYRNRAPKASAPKFRFLQLLEAGLPLITAQNRRWCRLE